MQLSCSAGISKHENGACAVYGARYCGDYLVATLILPSLNPNPEWEWHQLLWEKIRSRILVLTQEMPKGEMYWGAREGRAALCKGSELCLATKDKSSKPVHSSTKSLFHVVQGCLVPTSLRYC